MTPFPTFDRDSDTGYDLRILTLNFSTLAARPHMLPDWPSPKREIVRALMRHVRARVEDRSIAGIATSPVHEGHGTSMRRADGSVDERPFERAGAEIEIPVEAIATESLQGIFDRMDGIIDTLARAKSEALFRTVEEATRAAGTATDAGGRPITAELLLQAWEKMHIDFRANGQPQWPTIVIPPNQQDRFIVECARFKSEPMLRQQLVELINRKREEWIAREADRVLVG